MGTVSARGQGVLRLEVVLALGVLDFSLEQAIVVPALPVVQATFDTSLQAAVWMITAFLLAAAVATPLAGRLGDRYGRRRVLECSLVAFVVGSLICALADSIEPMIVGRVVQGLGAGVGPLAAALVREHVPAPRVPRAVGLIVGAGGAGGVVGLLGGALLVDHVSVQSVFWLLGATALGLLVAVHVAVPPSAGRRVVAVDWIGAGLLGGALVAVSLAIAQGNGWGWGSARVLGLFAGFALMLTGFVVRERVVAAPLLDPRGLARRPVWSAQLAAFAVGVALSVAYALVPFIGALPQSTGYGLGLSPTAIGLVLAPSAFAALVGGLAGGRLVTRIGARAVVVMGLLCIAVTYALFVLAHESAVLVAVAMLPLGFGVGCSIGAIVNLVLLSSDEAETGAVMGLNSVIRAIGSGLGAALAVAIVTASDAIAPGVPSESGFTAAFAASLATTLVAVAIVATIPRRSADPVIGAMRGDATPRQEVAQLT
jgi:MFS family permease